MYCIVHELFDLSVQPEIDKSKELGKAASKTGVKGELTCKAEGNPTVDFEWRKVSRQLFHACLGSSQNLCPKVSWTARCLIAQGRKAEQCAQFDALLPEAERSRTIVHQAVHGTERQ